MLKEISFLLFVFFTNISLYSQTFAPTGAKWYYSNTILGDTNFVTLQSIGDTIIQGKSCQIIDSPSTCLFGVRTYINSSTDSVFLYHEYLNDFQILYAFNSTQGDSWSFVLGQPNTVVFDTISITVDSTYSQTINSQSLKTLDVTYTWTPDSTSILPIRTYSSTIIQTIGDIQYLFNFPSHLSNIVCDDDYPKDLRCYSDSIFGSYETGIVDSCTHIGLYVGVNEIYPQQSNIWPNPSTDIININPIVNEPSDILIFDILGNMVFHKVVNPKSNNSFTIDISRLQSGVYYIFSKGQSLGKFTKF